MLSLCILVIEKDLHLVCLLVILKNPLSNIIGKFCLKEWLIALHYVKKCVCTSIQVRTLNISVYTIHYMDILLAYPSDGVLLPLLFL